MTDGTADNLSYRQGLDVVVRLLGGKGTSWAPAVLAALAYQPLRRSDLLDEVNRAETRWGNLSHRHLLSDKVLGETLVRMQANGLVVRRRVQQFQPSSWYELTPIARSLLAVLRPVAEWARAHHTQLPGDEQQRPQDEPA